MDRVPFDPQRDEDDPAIKPRRAERHAVDQAANLKSPNLYEVEVKIRDVSTCGFKAECAAPVLIGSFVSLDVPGIGQVEAQVRWQIGIRMGGMFVDPISLTRCEWVAVKAGVAG